MLGFIHALGREGVYLGDADLIVGTSAGARIGAQLAAGLLGQGVAMYQREEVPRLEIPVTLDKFSATVMQVVAATPDRQEVARRIANLEPLGSTLVPEEDRRAMVAAHLRGVAWPQKRLAIAAVDAQSGRRVVFDAASGVGLLDAVTASGALPGVFPLATINGRRYADGGVHSPYNADLAAGRDVVTVLTPIASNPKLRALLDSEIALLGEATVRVVEANQASLAAIGPNPLSSETARPALAAGARQAATEHEPLREIWNTGG